LALGETEQMRSTKVIGVSVEIREGVLTRCGSWARLSSARDCACQLAISGWAGLSLTAHGSARRRGAKYDLSVMKVGPRGVPDHLSGTENHGSRFRVAISDTHNRTGSVAGEAPTEPVIAAMFDHLHGLGYSCVHYKRKTSGPTWPVPCCCSGTSRCWRAWL